MTMPTQEDPVDRMFQMPEAEVPEPSEQVAEPAPAMMISDEPPAGWVAPTPPVPDDPIKLAEVPAEPRALSAREQLIHRITEYRKEHPPKVIVPVGMNEKQKNR